MMSTSDIQNPHSSGKSVQQEWQRKMKDPFSTFLLTSCLMIVWCSLRTSGNVNDEPLA